MKEHFLYILFVFFIFSCQNKDKKIIEKVKVEPEIIAYGLRYNNYDVIEDTIRKGETFGSILEKQNLDTLSVDEVVAIISDSIKVKNIRAGRVYTLFRTKDAQKKLQYLVYQPNKTSYYFVDFTKYVVIFFARLLF